ncbi:MAG: hypothetical protein ACI9BV_003747 [Rhodothermales bacterium]|jgi:hypothetical protein
MRNVPTIVETAGLQKVESESDSLYMDASHNQFDIVAKHGLQAMRDLRSAVLEMAIRVEKSQKNTLGILILNEPLINLARLTAEWRSIRSLLRKDVARKVVVLAVYDGSAAFLGPQEEDSPDLSQIMPMLSPRSKDRRPLGHYTIAKVLLRRWLLRKPPITQKTLGQISGYSSPTVSKAVHKMASYLRVGSAGKLELTSFPRQMWHELVTNSVTARQTVLFTDVSRRPRSSAYLLRRLSDLEAPGRAIGGVLAAEYWHPKFDLAGIPRLDICVHSPRGGHTVDFIRELDPGLEEVKSSSASVSVAVHGVFEPEMTSQMHSEMKLPVADPVECLLDLHEMRLFDQAQALIDFLRASPQNE